MADNKQIPLISFQMVSKTFGDDPLEYKNLVLKNIYFEIFEGEFVIVFGPSGSGKSTLLNLMAGLESPTGGRVLIRRKDVSQFNNEELSRYHRLRMGMVFQSFNLIKSLSVWENVALPQTASGVRYSTRRERAIKLLRMLKIDHYADRHPNELSGGEQQRVAIARALINNPYFLLVDEPTGNLDSKSAEAVMEILRDLNDRNKHTIVLVTHNPNHIHYATRVVYIEDGKIIIEEKREREAVAQAPTAAPALAFVPNEEEGWHVFSKNDKPLEPNPEPSPPPTGANPDFVPVKPVEFHLEPDASPAEAELPRDDPNTGDASPSPVVFVPQDGEPSAESDAPAPETASRTTEPAAPSFHPPVIPPLARTDFARLQQKSKGPYAVD